jgi:hypothetical protein
MAERGSGGGWWPERSGEGDSGGEGEPDSTEGGSGEGGGGPPHRPPRGLASRDAPKVSSRYSTFVGLAFVALVIVAVLNAIGSEGGGTAGSDPEASRGLPISEFAVPEIGGGLEGDANVAQDDCESSSNPCPADQVREPACEIDDPGAIRVCDLFDRPLAISFWFTRGGDCLPTQDNFDEVASRRAGEVNFLSINTLDDRADVEEIVRERGWSVAAGHDADGAVATLFGIGGCPTVVLAYPGGVLYRTEAGTMSVAQIDSLIDELLEVSEEREPGGGA